MGKTSFQQSQSTDPVSVPAALPVTASGSQTHTIEPELLGSRPRRARWTERTAAVRRLLWNLMFGTVLTLFFFARNDIATWDALMTRGVSVTATVWEKSANSNGFGSNSRQTHYSFTRDGHVYYGTTGEYPSADIGNTLPVTYLPGSKGEKWQLGGATLRERREDRLGEWMLAGFIAVALCGAGIALFEQETRGQRRLLRNGLATVGRVVSSNITNTNSKTHWLCYEYLASGSIQCTRSVIVSPSEFERYTLNNRYVTVLYDETECMRSKPYFQLTAAELAGR